MLKMAYAHFPNLPRPSDIDWPFTVMAWTDELLEADVRPDLVMALYRRARSQKGDFMPSVQDILNQWDSYRAAMTSQLEPTFHERMGLVEADRQRAAIERFQAAERERREHRKQMIRALNPTADDLQFAALVEPEVMDE